MPFLWFDTQAEEAVAFDLSVFKDGKIRTTTPYPEEGPGPAGAVMTIGFELKGERLPAVAAEAGRAILLDGLAVGAGARLFHLRRLM